MTTDTPPARSVTLNADQVTAVLIALVGDQERREIAARIMAQAMLAAEAPVSTPTGGLDALSLLQGLRLGLADVLGDTTMLRMSTDEVVERVRSAVRADDTERERRVSALVDAVGELLHASAPPMTHPATTVRDAYEALREYAPAEVVAPGALGGGPLPVELTLPTRADPTQPPPAAPASSVRDELHALAPLPWTFANEGYNAEVATSDDGLHIFRVCMDRRSAADDVRLAELLVELVNSPAPIPPAVQAVVDAARAYTVAWRGSHGGRDAARVGLFGTVATLDRAAPGGVA